MTASDWKALLTDVRNLLDSVAHVPGFDIDLLIGKIDTALTQPEPEKPTNEQINQCYAALYGLNTDKLGLMPVRFGRELLARWGRPAIEPIPVSERLPGPEDCGPGGICWLWDPIRRVWHLTHFTYLNPGDFWLPYHALLIPRSEEK